MYEVILIHVCKLIRSIVYMASMLGSQFLMNQLLCLQGLLFEKDIQFCMPSPTYGISGSTLKALVMHVAPALGHYAAELGLEH
jgi:hypothetical protein